MRNTFGTVQKFLGREKSFSGFLFLAGKVFPDFNFSRKHFFGFQFLTGKVFPDFTF